MEYYYAVEPDFAGTHWGSQCIQGIKREATINKGRLVRVSLAETQVLEKLAAEERPAIILVGSLLSWMSDTSQRLGQAGIHSILLASNIAHNLRHTSAITADYEKYIYDICRYLAGCQRSRIALWGIYPNSLNDLTKEQAFRDIGAGSHAPGGSVFQNRGSLDQCCQDFYEVRNHYDAVICSNDITAIKLTKYLNERGVSIPQDMYVVGIGETRLSAVIKPGITTMSLDFYSVGRYAVRLYHILKRNPLLSSLQAKMSGTMTVRESTQWRPAARTSYELPLHTLAEQSSFYEDGVVQELFKLENLISRCTEEDFTLLRRLKEGEKYATLAEELFMTEGALRYRVKRLLALAEAESVEKLIALFTDFVDWEKLKEL